MYVNYVLAYELVQSFFCFFVFSMHELFHYSLIDIFELTQQKIIDSSVLTESKEQCAPYTLTSFLSPYDYIQHYSLCF